MSRFNPYSSIQLVNLKNVTNKLSFCMHETEGGLLADADARMSFLSGCVFANLVCSFFTSENDKVVLHTAFL